MRHQTLILGAGLSGLSVSHHLGHERCYILEKSLHPYGHIRSVLKDRFTWDEGPHVSFTKNSYVANLFARGVGGEFREFEVKVGNYYKGHWIKHPAQTSLHEVPEPLRSRCVESFLEARAAVEAGATKPANYEEWLVSAFGRVFAEEFPANYTKKYWTRSASELTTDWIGRRICYPSLSDVLAGAKGPLDRSMYYMEKVRYPKSGGYQAFAKYLYEGARVRFGATIGRIDLGCRQVHLSNGDVLSYEQLVNTIPLPEFMRLCGEVPADVMEAVRALDCTSLLIVNTVAPHPTRRSENWVYVYDANKYSTRINFTERLSPHNAPEGWTGVQTEVYHSRKHPLAEESVVVSRCVRSELVELGLLDEEFASEGSSPAGTVDVRWANVIFDHDTAPALDTIWTWLERFGLVREPDDTHPLTDWDRVDTGRQVLGSLAFAGRFGQWKYFWTDDCVLRGRAFGGGLYAEAI